MNQHDSKSSTLDKEIVSAIRYTKMFCNILTTAFLKLFKKN